jgi:hypothetical protein
VGERVSTTVVRPDSYDHAIDPDKMWRGGGDIGALRVYQAYHPGAAIYTVTYRGRTVWMTSKQRAIWSEVQHYWRRDKRDVLQRIANVVGCSKATVSRFLRRLDLWRFIDLVTVRGRTGGTYIFTRRDLDVPQKRWTMSARERIRRYRAHLIRKDALIRLEPRLVLYRLPRPPWKGKGYQPPLPGLGSTDATFR